MYDILKESLKRFSMQIRSALTGLSMYLCAHACIYICLRVYVPACVCVCMCLRVYVHACICACVCMYACAYVCMKKVMDSRTERKFLRDHGTSWRGEGWVEKM